MRWSFFVTLLSATGGSHTVVTLLYEMQSPCNFLTLSLSGSDSRKRNSWRDDNDATMEIKCHAGDDGDHDDASVMEIMSTR